MLGLSKFRSLPPVQQVRKVYRWLLPHQEGVIEAHLCATLVLDGIQSGRWATLLGPPTQTALSTWAEGIHKGASDDHARHRALLLVSKDVGQEAAEWDLVPGGGAQPASHWDIAVYCEDFRSPFNIGSVFRTAEAFGFSKVYLSPACTTPDQSQRLVRSSMGATTRIPWEQTDLLTVIAEWGGSTEAQPLFALELGGNEPEHFLWPQRGIVVLGSEELGVDPGTLARCQESAGVVSIPLHGTKTSLNVGVSFGILAHEWTSRLKQTRSQ